MPNSIEQVKSYLSTILDEVYKKSSLSARLDLANSFVRPVQGAAGTVLIPSVSFDTGLANYDKTTGAKTGTANLSWEPFTLKNDRAKQFNIDAVENMESLGVMLSNMGSQFMREYVVPEIDATRFAAYATKANTKKAETLTAETIEAALQTAFVTLRDAEVPEERLILFISNACYALLEESVMTRRRVTGLEVVNGVARYNGVDVIPVPINRFHDKVTLTPAGGFVPAGNEINFMLMDKASAVQVTRHISDKLFSPEENQQADGWLWRYRIYHDAFVPKNKVAGIYLNHKGV